MWNIKLNFVGDVRAQVAHIDLSGIRKQRIRPRRGLSPPRRLYLQDRQENMP
ncbi:hypothetical protein [Aquamicrobium sp.]|uniref:hypothetical protein n=1 Tax=Aquamicrobium sp. TaxID=1872579 RepID=UPI00258D3D2A|nr:hypothetical protein [Aquamicrobium sp.]MCK9549779.1 hypothetical protein [Aquamicrobium sp.]